MVFTAVGAKCPECARMPRSARVTIRPGRLALTIVAGVFSIAAGNYLFTLAISFIGFFSIIFAFGIGYGTGELVSWASGRHHSPWLAAWAAACAGTAVAFTFLIPSIPTNGLTLETFSSTLLLGGIWKPLWIAAAAFGAWRRNA
jgi:hypothetical protein